VAKGVQLRERQIDQQLPVDLFLFQLDNGLKA